ncbi:MAG: hypothetical protein EOR60_19720 [Mesorhizobium sp.]|nr:MAG: hypothetical protein EOR60_19720 [Mesorhizobium sp.]
MTKAVQKLLKFGESGGDIDFVAPPPPLENPEDGPDHNDGATKELIDEIWSAREAILAYQEEREAVKLLSHRTDGSNTAM